MLWCKYNQVEVQEEQKRPDGTSVGRGLVAARDFGAGEVGATGARHAV